MLDTSQARFCYTDEVGQPKRGSVYAKTQKECRQKLTAKLKAIDEETYRKSEKKIKVADWLKEWFETYCTDLKPQTLKTYESRIRQQLIPHIGDATLQSLTNAQIQRLINRLAAGTKLQKPMAPKTVKCVHGILHKALSQAVVCGYIQVNPADHIKLPKAKKPDLKPMMDDDIHRFLERIKGERFELLFYVDLFTGMRQSEILGLEWSDIDFEAGTIHIQRQLQRKYKETGFMLLDETKNGKDRIASISPSVVKVLKEQRRRQLEWQLAAGQAWSNPDNLVFTNEIGGHLVHSTVRNHFKRVMRDLGMDTTRFHDMRHSYAINALQYGDTPNEVSEQLGHYSSAFTMDVYGGVSKTARKASQERMENFIKSVSNG